MRTRGAQHRHVILRSPDLIGTTKDLRSSWIVDFRLPIDQKTKFET
jgi:hypothetical protein